MNLYQHFLNFSFDKNASSVSLGISHCDIKADVSLKLLEGSVFPAAAVLDILYGGRHWISSDAFLSFES